MTFSEALTQLKAFARQDGFILSLVWIAGFVMTLVLPRSPWGSLLILSTPFVVGWRLGAFRDEALHGSVSFRRGFTYSVFTFFYASILFALMQYAYFKFFDHGQFASSLTDTGRVLIEAYSAKDISVKELKESLDMMTSLTPIQLSFIFMMQNLMFGLILSVPVALFCRRRKRFT